MKVEKLTVGQLPGIGVAYKIEESTAGVGSINHTYWIWLEGEWRPADSCRGPCIFMRTTKDTKPHGEPDVVPEGWYRFSDKKPEHGQLCWVDRLSYIRAWDDTDSRWALLSCWGSGDIIRCGDLWRPVEEKPKCE